MPGFRQDGLGSIDRAGFHQAVLHVQAFGCQEGIRHAAADDELVAFGKQVFDHQDLVADLGAAQDGNIGMFRVGNRPPQVFQFLFHQETGNGRQEVRHALGRGMRAMRRTKGIIDVHIAQRSHLLGQSHIVLFFFGMEAGIFQHDHFTRFEGFCHRFDFRPDAIRRHLDRDAQKPGQHFRRGFQAEFGIESALRTAKVAHQQQGCTLFEHILDGGKAALIRLSSVTLPSAIGTLKSTRIRTRLPFRSISLTVFLSMLILLVK